MIDFDGQVAIVTGAGRGMGRCIALLLAQRGARVVVNDYGGDEFGNAGTSREAEAVVDEIRAAGGKAVANAATVGDGASADAIVRAALDAFGRIDVLINNAGGSTIAPIDELSDAALERVMRTNYWGAYMLIRRVWPHMRTQRYGRIVNVCSSAVLGIGTIAPYSSAKGAMVGLTHEAAIEGRPYDIFVNGTFPAGYSRLAAKSAEDARRWMETWFQPELVAQAYAYFASRAMQHSGDIYSVGAGRVSRIALVNNDGYFNRELTPELVAQHIDQIRDLTTAVHVGSSWEENQRYQRWVPWTGGQAGTFGASGDGA
jgi:NAD(P)-dependent dehydrogenase (short-subunit alcohol dehydrogenase family)